MPVRALPGEFHEQVSLSSSRAAGDHDALLILRLCIQLRHQEPPGSKIPDQNFQVRASLAVQQQLRVAWSEFQICPVQVTAQHIDCKSLGKVDALLTAPELPV